MHDLRGCSDLCHGGLQHFMGHCACKKDKQIRAADSGNNSGIHSGEYFGITVILRTNIFVAANHTLISSHDDNAHIIIPPQCILHFGVSYMKIKF